MGLGRVFALFAGLLLSLSHAYANETITYTYDELGRLVATSTTGTVNNGQSVSTSFDPAGNRTNYTVTGAGGGTSAQLDIGNASATEGGNLVFTVTRSGTTTTAVSVDYASASGTATSGSDFTAASGTLSFAANETSKTITVATIDDPQIESTETMTVTLSGALSGATISTATGTGTINDNDTPPAQLAIGNASATEGGNLVFTVTRSGTTTSAVSVDYASASGTATSGSDFTAASGTLNFAANETSKTITVASIDDATTESTEAMTVTLSGASSGATISTATGTGSILDNDTGWSSTLTVGITMVCPPPIYICATTYGYVQSTQLGSMSNTTFNGATIKNLYSVVYGNGGKILYFSLQGASTAPPNSGWTSITIPGAGAVNRASGTYSTSGTIATWYWGVPNHVSNGTVTIQ